MIKTKNSIIKSYIMFWKNAFDFKTRTRRSDYWNAYLINIIINVVLSVFNLIDSEPIQMLTAILLILYSIAVLIPQLSITIRRLHDVGKEGYYILLSLVPIVGQIIMLINLVKDSQQESNKFGDSPKYISKPNDAFKEEEFCPICKSPISPYDEICPKCSSVIHREDEYGQ